MARKKIGLFMSEITQFFQKSCGQKIIEQAAKRDMDVIIYTSYGSYSCPYGRNLLSEMGKKNIIHLPDYSVFDAIIALPNTFDIYGMDQEFYNLLRENAKCPVICLQNGAEDFYTLSIENRDSMYRMTKHFIEEHKFTKICYMSGPFKSKDSPDRLAGFKQAMEEAGLEIKDHTIYEGNYWTNRGAKAMDFFLNGTDDYPEVVICANDYMAISICDELKKRGKKIPMDVCVAGFDGILEGEQYEPSLTTVTIKAEDYAEKAIQIIDDIADGKEFTHEITMSNELSLKRSCGCGKHHFLYSYNDSERILRDSEILLREAGRITADYQNNYDIDNSMSVANYYFGMLGCDNGFLCLCDENDPMFKSIEQNKIFSDGMVLMQKMQLGKREHAEVFKRKFPRTAILPPEIFETDSPRAYIIYPLYYKSRELGYLVLNPTGEQWPNALVHTYINALSSAIENNYYHNQFLELAEIKKLSQTDPLTGLFNRRGFENGLQEIMESASEDMTISIVSIDMDNLKHINDFYGHADGDFALKTLSKILEESLDEGEICARFGGDEFSAVLISDNPVHADEFARDFSARLAKASMESGKPYPIHASIGICDLQGGNTNQIYKCMQIADERMYVNKRNYKKMQEPVKR